MKVVLLERVEKLGKMGEIVDVRPGYARNYLLPTKKAMRATKESLEMFEKQRAQLEAENQKRREEAEKAAGKIGGTKIIILRQAGETGQLYGSVTNRDIAAALSDKGHTIARQNIVIDSAIKTVGVYSITLVLHPEVKTTISVSIAPSAEEAQRLQNEASREAAKAAKEGSEEEAA